MFRDMSDTSVTRLLSQVPTPVLRLGTKNIALWEDFVRYQNIDD